MLSKILVIRRAKTACGAPTGFVQPLIPLAGVTPVNKLDVLQALNEPGTMVIDMRDEDARLGYPVSKIFYDCGGMLDLESIGLTTVTGNRPLPLAR